MRFARIASLADAIRSVRQALQRGEVVTDTSLTARTKRSRWAGWRSGSLVVAVRQKAHLQQSTWQHVRLASERAGERCVPVSPLGARRRRAVRSGWIAGTPRGACGIRLPAPDARQRHAGSAQPRT